MTESLSGKISDIVVPDSEGHQVKAQDTHLVIPELHFVMLRVYLHRVLGHCRCGSQTHEHTRQEQGSTHGNLLVLLLKLAGAELLGAIYFAGWQSAQTNDPFTVKDSVC
jgi:hypothetical protein